MSYGIGWVEYGVLTGQRFFVVECYYSIKEKSWLILLLVSVLSKRWRVTLLIRHTW